MSLFTQIVVGFVGILAFAFATGSTIAYFGRDPNNNTAPLWWLVFLSTIFMLYLGR